MNVLNQIKNYLKSRRQIRSTTFYQIGGQKTVNRLVDDFYLIMSTDPLAKNCFETHQGKDIAESAEKLKLFLAGWLGGPQLYLGKHGHPRLRMRHFPFVIGEKERAEWMYCMKKSLDGSKIKIVQQEEMLKAFEGVAQLIKNRD